MKIVSFCSRSESDVPCRAGVGEGNSGGSPGPVSKFLRDSGKVKDEANATGTTRREFSFH